RRLWRQPRLLFAGAAEQCGARTLVAGYFAGAAAARRGAASQAAVAQVPGYHGRESDVGGEYYLRARDGSCDWRGGPRRGASRVPAESGARGAGGGNCAGGRRDAAKIDGFLSQAAERAVHLSDVNETGDGRFGGYEKWNWPEQEARKKPHSSPD